MSTTTSPAPASAVPVDAPIRTYRGKTLEELLPQIREELGSDAIVVRQRDGLMGGVGGFFQQRFVEVDAMAGRPRVDVYDEEPATPESFAQALAVAEEADPIVTAAAFAPPVAEPPAEGIEGGAAAVAPQAEPASVDRAGGAGEDDSASLLAERLTPRQDPPASTAEPEPEPMATEPTLADILPTTDPLGAAPAASLAAALGAAGLSPAFAARLIADAEAHELPFTAGDEREAVRHALARRMPASLPHRAGGLAVAFAGPGSTACADALATTYVRAGRRAHTHATLEQARTRIERGDPDAVIALDLPPIPHDDQAAVEHLASRLASVELDEVLLVVPAGAAADELSALHERFAPLAPTGLALRCDDPAAALGAAVELACTTRLPFAYVLDPGTPVGARIAPADPAEIAERLLP